MVRLGFLLIKHRRGGRSIAPQDELHHFQGHDPETGATRRCLQFLALQAADQCPESVVDLNDVMHWIIPSLLNGR